MVLFDVVEDYLRHYYSFRENKKIFKTRTIFLKMQVIKKYKKRVWKSLISQFLKKESRQDKGKL